MRIRMLVPSLLLMAGCMLLNVHQRQAKFNEQEYAPYDRPGTSSVSGQAFLRTRGGEVKHGAGNNVHLHPVTTYSTEEYEVTYLQGQPISADDSRALKHTRTMRSDGEGRFSFEGLPEGEYYVWCMIVWEIPSNYGGTTTTGGTAAVKVRIGRDEHVKNLIVTR